MVPGLLLVLAISGANEAATCEWPTVVAYRAGEKCSGVLVHPEVVVTAAHCLVVDSVARVRFGERSSPDEFDAEVESCTLSPDLGPAGWGAGDLAACVLKEPVLGIPPTPILTACEAETLSGGDQAVIVGFGGADTDPEYGTKRYGFTTLASELKDGGTLDVGDPDVTGCLGDSGGPALVRLADGSWRVLGVLSGGSDCDGTPGTYVALHPHLPWLESVTGRDLTPCHDDEGTWAASDRCEGATVEPIDGAAIWEEMCASAVSVPTPTCAPADDGITGSDGGTGVGAAASAGCRVGHGGHGWLVLLVLAGLGRCGRAVSSRCARAHPGSAPRCGPRPRRQAPAPAWRARPGGPPLPEDR